MILVIRGHIRDSFKTSDLYQLVKNIYNIQNDLKIFIHTWNTFANNVSWRNIKIDNTQVTKENIYIYFDDLKHLIETIIIDDDSCINLVGNLNGKINGGPMPLIGWKNYWYGKYRIIDHIYKQNIYVDEIIINLRFDVLNNSVSYSQEKIINFIKNNLETKITTNIFIANSEVNGIDNIYIGNIDTLYKLTHYFFYYLDDILMKNTDTVHQERFVYRINNTLFK